jgi:hypothetical protein
MPLRLPWRKPAAVEPDTGPEYPRYEGTSTVTRHSPATCPNPEQHFLTDPMVHVGSLHRVYSIVPERPDGTVIRKNGHW